eukprot:m.482546 g.482546  ORF g.482546 m.482546 type:complete len:288 (-) comp22576_c0_seq1:211-1074(-)
MPNNSRQRTKIEWAMFANVLGVTFGGLLVIGGVISQTEEFDFQRIGIFSMAAGAFVFLIEYPRGKRQRGRTIPRRFQHYVTPLVEKTGPLASNYFLRALVWIGASVPQFFSLALIIPGIVGAVCATVYFYAAFRGEQWVPLAAPKEDTPKPAGRILEAPKRAPPRLPDGVQKTQPHPRRTAEPAAASYTRNPTFQETTTLEAKPSSHHAARPAAKPQPAARKPAVASKPRVAAKPALRLQQSVDFPWESDVDPATGNTYYINTETDITTWDKPAGWDEYMTRLSSES